MFIIYTGQDGKTMARNNQGVESEVFEPISKAQAFVWARSALMLELVLLTDSFSESLRPVLKERGLDLECLVKQDEHALFKVTKQS